MPKSQQSLQQIPNDPDQRVHGRILVVDDEPLIRKLIGTRLQWKGYQVTLTGDGEAGIESFQREAPDLLILDLMLPRLNGFEVLREVRTSSDVPVLMLTACDRLEDRILGLELGADDYLVKPFSMTELEARIRALLRRTRSRPPQQASNPSAASAPPPSQIEISGLTIHFGIRQVFRGLARIKLTSMEFSLLELLVSKAGQAVPRLEIMRSIWGYAPARHADTRVVDVHIARLRLKLERDPKNPELIQTARGLGYLFSPHSDSP